MPAFLLLADWMVSQPDRPATRRFELLLYLAFILPLLGPLARWTHVQLSVMATILYSVASRRNSVAKNRESQI